MTCSLQPHRYIPTLIGALVLCAASTLAGTTSAQDKQPIRVLVGYAPGGVGDTVARLLASRLHSELGQTVIVENRPGANGRLAAMALKAAAADGNTFLQAPDAFAVFPTLLHPPGKLKYSVLGDMLPVARVVSYPIALVVRRDIGVDSVKQYAAWLKANPAKAQYGTAGAGGQMQFYGSLLGQALGTPLTLVPYQGNGPLMNDLLGGQVTAGIMVAGDALKHRSDKLRVLAVFARSRWALAPEVPTLAEQGYEMKADLSWLGWWAPAHTPPARIERVQTALQKILVEPGMREAITRTAMVSPDFQTAAQLERDLRADLQFWGPVIKSSGYKPED